MSGSSSTTSTVGVGNFSPQSFGIIRILADRRRNDLPRLLAWSSLHRVYSRLAPDPSCPYKRPSRRAVRRRAPGPGARRPVATPRFQQALHQSARDLRDIKRRARSVGHRRHDERPWRHHLRQRQVLRDLEVLGRRAPGPQPPHPEFRPPPRRVLQGNVPHDRQRPGVARRNPQSRQRRQHLLGRYDDRPFSTR